MLLICHEPQLDLVADDFECGAYPVLQTEAVSDNMAMLGSGQSLWNNVWSYPDHSLQPQWSSQQSKKLLVILVLTDNYFLFTSTEVKCHGTSFQQSP